MSAILRKRLSKGFTTLSNATLRDKAISFRATGLLAFLLSMDDGWSMDGKVISERKGHEGRDAVRSAARELRVAGYMRHVKKREAGRYLTEVEVSDVPVEEWKGGVLVDESGVQRPDEGGDALGDEGGDGGDTSAGKPGPGEQGSGEPAPGKSGDQGSTQGSTPGDPPNPPPTAGGSGATQQDQGQDQAQAGHAGQHANCRACGTNRRGRTAEPPDPTEEMRAAARAAREAGDADRPWVHDPGESEAEREARQRKVAEMRAEREEKAS